VIIINTKIHKRNKFKDLLSKIYSKSEDLLFYIINKIPDKFIPAFIMNWLEHYSSKRLAKLKQEVIHQRWQTIELEKVVDNIHQRQQP